VASARRNRSAQSATATTSPAGLAVASPTNGVADSSDQCGSYSRLGTITEADTRFATVTMVIGKRRTVTPAGSARRTLALRRAPRRRLAPPGCGSVHLQRVAAAPTNVEHYTVVGTITDANYQVRPRDNGDREGDCDGDPRWPQATYTGAAQSATATTSPAGLR